MEQPFFILVLVLCLIVFFSKAWRTWMKPSETNTKITPSPRLPPGPWKLPIIGNMHQLFGASLPHCRLRDLANKHGPIIHLQLGEVSHVVISSPDAAKEVMKIHDISFAQRPFTPEADVLFYGSGGVIFAPYGESWRQLRKIYTRELLSAKHVQSFRQFRESEVSCLVSSMFSNAAAGTQINLTRMFNSLTINIISKAAFSNSSSNDQRDFSPLVPEYVMVLGGFSIADFFPSNKFLHALNGTMAKVKKLHKKADRILENVINEHRASKATGTNRTEAKDFVDVLLDLQDHGNLDFPLKTDNVKAVILDIFLAGVETSSVVMDWAMSEMMKNPKTLERAQTEVRQIFYGKEKVCETSLHELKYLNAVIKETLRLHPPAPLLVPREARESIKINGYEIPAKTKVIVNAWAIGRDHHYWNEAERFCPERFLDSSIDYKGTNFEYIPFGAGRRMCPGMLFGTAVVEIALASLLFHFDWKLPSGMNSETLDMSEASGSGARRKHDLCLIPFPYNVSKMPME